MKRLISVLLLMMMVSCACAEDIDLSGLSYAELVALKDRINLAMWKSEEWQEVTVPIGLYEVGKDIPAGHWTISSIATYYSRIEVCDKLDTSGTDVNPYIRGSVYYCDALIKNPKSITYKPNDDITAFSVNLYEGLYVAIKEGSVVFTPYTGKPSLGFK